MDRINFYAEVEILPNCEYTEFIGEKGVVMGISEEDGIIYGYAVRLYTDYENGYCFDAGCLKPTGRQFKREDFYS